MREVDPADGDGFDDDALRAAHQVEVAAEWVERGFGALLDAHHDIGHAQLLLLDAAHALEEAGHADLAARAREEVAARDAVAGRWTYQMVDECRAHLLEPVRAFDEGVRERLSGGVRHRYEARQKRRDAGRDARTSVALPDDRSAGANP